jgi:quinate dehydrogenase (quinone)
MSTPDTIARSPLWVRIFGVVLALMGLALLVGGIRLASLGGSWYYLIAGAATLVSGVLLVRAKPQGTLLFLLVVIGSALWALAEVGTNFWGLVPRLAPMLVLGLIAALALRCMRPSAKQIAVPAAAVQAVVLVAGAASIFTPHNTVENTAKLGTQVINDVPVVTDANSKDNRWTQFGRNDGGDRFGPFDQITPDNVNKLEVAWTYRTGADVGGPNEDQVTPIHIGDSVYLCTPQNKVIALDAETGQEKWTFDSKGKVSPHWNRCRGVGYYEVPQAQKSADGKCDARIITTDKVARLWALDAKTGEVCQSFGDTGNGYTDLSRGLGENLPDFWYMNNSQPLVAGDYIVLGGWVFDGIQTDEPSGVVRGYHAKTGELAWAWDLGNPDIDMMPKAGETYSKGTPNFWSHGAYDAKLGLVYIPLGNATPDFWGAHRTPEMNKYATSVVALNVKTGKEAWHFQALHMDTWDYDNGSPPMFVDMPDGKGGMTPSVILATKTHQLFVLDRATGEPVVPVEERPVPNLHVQEGDAPAAPTQPWSTMPQLGAMDMKESDMWGVTMFDQMLCRIRFKQLNYAGPYTKLESQKMTLVWPGYYGGFNWGGMTYDPRTNMMITNDIHMPQIVWLEPGETAKERLAEFKAKDGPKAGWKNAQQNGTPFAALRSSFMSVLGLPCHAPSWGNMVAIDLNTRQVAWRTPTSTVEDSEMMGVRTGLPVPLGLPALGAPISTAGGLVFHAGTQDYYIRAYETATGKEVWKQRMPVGAQAAPITYLSPESGRQFVVISAGGARQTKHKGDYVIGYALPKK